MFLAAGFLAAAQPPSTYHFFSRLGHTRTLWDDDALTGAFATSLVAALWALIAVGLPGRLDEIPPRLWTLLVVAGVASATLALS